ncbi:MAG TPA: transglutaminase family protein [Allosphingosinicella sp.]|uniref:transglutaminase family protein n=1 Tax=Allosphingosinicella sp. TaxID=2823234 RepID=UPI002EDA8A94
MSDAVAAVEAVLSLPHDKLDYARAKIAFDRIIDPSIDEQWVLAELDGLTERARELAGASARDNAKLNALHKLIYRSGPWNEHRPFSYDHDDPLGQGICRKLLSNYLRTRLGQCVSMPILYLILAERLGLAVALSSAPDHLFVRYSNENGRIINLETTSGALPAREEWMRQCFSITDVALKSGLYLRSFSKREAIGRTASTANEYLMEQGRYEEVAGVSAAILRRWPRDDHALLSFGSAYGHLIEEFRKKYPTALLIPPPLRHEHRRMVQLNDGAFEAVKALGWQPR